MTDVKFLNIGQVIFDRSRRELCTAQQRIYLEPKLFALLELLVNAEQGQVSRDQLITEVWQGRVVSEGAINRAISLLRKAFASLDPSTPYIETLPKLGYRLAAPVSLAVHSPEYQHKSRTGAAMIGVSLVLVLLLGWLAISWFRPDTSPQWLSSGTPLTRLTHLEGSEFAISANAKQVLFHHLDQQNHSQIWLLQQGQATQLTTDSLQHQGAALDPSGRWIVFARHQNQQCEVSLIDLQQHTAHVLFGCPPDSVFQASWLASSEGFYFRQREDKTKPYALFRYLLATGQRQQLTAPASDNLAGEISLAAAPASAVGSAPEALASARYIGHQATELLVMQAPNWHSTHRQKLPFAISHLQWLTPELLLLSSDTTLYQYHLPSAQWQPLYQAKQRIQSFVAVANQLYVAEQQAESGIWRYQLATGQQDAIIAAQYLNTMPRISRDGQTLYFLSNRSGQYQIWQQTAAGELAAIAELPAGPHFTRLSLAPDQTKLIFSQDGAAYEVDLSSRRPNQLLDSSSGANVVNYTDDSAGLVFSSDRSGDWQLWQYQPADQTLTQLTSGGGYSGVIRDGQLYFSRYHQQGLWRKTLPDGDEELLLADFDLINWLNWQLLDDRLYFYRPQSGIWQYSLTTGETQIVMPLVADFVHQFSVNKDSIYYVKRGRVAGDIYQIPLLRP